MVNVPAELAVTVPLPPNEIDVPLIVTELLASIVLVTVPVSPVVIKVPVVAGMVIVAVPDVLAPVNVIEPPLLAWNTKLDIKSPEF
jgi:hypothetical protein